MTQPRKSIMVTADLHKRLRVLAAANETTIAKVIELALDGVRPRAAAPGRQPVDRA
jgi:hypothetical protein